MKCNSEPTPVQQVRDAAENAVLGNQRAAGAASEEGVDGSMVVEEQVEGGAVAEGGEGEGPISSKEFGCLLGEDPWGAREEARAHGVFPNANVEDAGGSLGCIGEEVGCIRAWALGNGFCAPCRECHGQSLQEGANEVGAGAGAVFGAMTEGSVGACQEGEDSAGWLGKPDQLSNESADSSDCEGPSGEGEPLQDHAGEVRWQGGNGAEGWADVFADEGCRGLGRDFGLGADEEASSLQGGDGLLD